MIDSSAFVDCIAGQVKASDTSGSTWLIFAQDVSFNSTPRIFVLDLAFSSAKITIDGYATIELADL